MLVLLVSTSPLRVVFAPGAVLGGAKLLVIPIAAGGGLAAYKKLRSGSDDSPATPYGSPVGPVATPATVTPPKTAPGANTTLNGEVGDTTTPAAGPESTSTS